MAAAIRLARRGIGTTHPNPRVGAVVLRGSTVVARGWHERAGEAHAETRALERAGSAASGATLVVTLEPCAHVGRTPLCERDPGRRNPPRRGRHARPQSARGQEGNRGAS